MNETTPSNCTHEPRPHRKGWRALLLTTAAIAGIGITVAIAGNHYGGHWNAADRVHFMVERMTERLDLTAEQQASIKAILEASQNSAAPYRDELTTLRTDMRELIEADEYYEDQVRIRLQSKAAAMVELGVIATRTMHDVRAELTPDQRAEAQAMMKRFAEKGERHRGWRHRQLEQLDNDA